MVDTKLRDACVRKIVSEWCGKSLQQLIDIDIDIAGSYLQIEQIGLKGQNVPAVLAYTYMYRSTYTFIDSYSNKYIFIFSYVLLI